MSHTRTYTYTILEVSRDTWQDIKDRLEESETLDDYLDGNLIIFGTVALQAES